MEDSDDDIIAHFFKFVEAYKNNGTHSRVTKECKLCQRVYHSFRYSDYNFHHHLKTAHNEQLENYQKNKRKSKVPSQDLLTMKTKQEMSKYLSKPLALKFKKMIISFGISLDIVNNSEFADFIHELDPQFEIPHSKTLKKEFNSYYKSVEATIRNLLKEATYITTSFDLWVTKSMVTYLSVNANYISKSWNFEHKLLTFKRIFGIPNEATIINEYELILHKFGIVNNVFLNITSNTANLLQAIQLKYTNDSDPTINELYSCEHDYTFDEFIDGNKHLKIETDKINGIINQSKSFIHTLLFIVMESMQSVSDLIETLQICREILSYIRLGDLDNELKLLLQQCLYARKVSDIHMFQIFFDVYEKISAILKQNGEESWLLSQSQQEILKEFIEILQPFQEAIDFLFNNSFTFISKCLPTIVALKQHLQLLVSVHLKPLTQALISSLEIRLQEIYEDPIYVISTILHPAWKMAPFIQANRQMKAKKMLMDELYKISESSAIGDMSLEESAKNNLEPHPKKSRLSLMFQVFKTNHQQILTRHEIELESYLLDDQIKENFNPLIFWKTNEAKYPYLSILSRKYLSIPAISMPIEKIRSLTDDIIKDRTNFKTGDIFFKTAVLKYNLDLF